MTALALKQDFADVMFADGDGGSRGGGGMSFSTKVLCTPSTPPFLAAKLGFNAMKDLKERSYRYPKNIYDLNVKIVFFDLVNPIEIQCYPSQTLGQIAINVHRALGIV